MHSQGLSKHQRRDRAFTLVELLVVISVLGILAALLLPTLTKTRSKAAQTMDLNNLKQLMVAMQLYSTDHKDVLPWPNWGPSSKRPGWLYTVDANATGPSRFRLDLGLLWPSLKNAHLYMCPMDTTNGLLFQQRPQQLSSYAMNGSVIGYNRAVFPAVRLTQMQPQDIALWETDEKQPQYFNDGANFPTEGVSSRHQNGAINANFSGGVSYVKLGAWYLQVYDTNRNSLWCYPNSPDGR